ncbi:hypothetical protein Barb7_02636 [Bacteroidales bacterium Barb7]|nr:hypothetical protein Barb7_02636 [Bacteroidales bacterium Barb7]
MNNDTRIMILLTGELLILDTLPEGVKDFSPTFRCAPCEAEISRPFGTTVKHYQI